MAFSITLEKSALLQKPVDNLTEAWKDQRTRAKIEYVAKFIFMIISLPCLGCCYEVSPSMPNSTSYFDLETLGKIRVILLNSSLEELKEYRSCKKGSGRLSLTGLARHKVLTFDDVATIKKIILEHDLAQFERDICANLLYNVYKNKRNATEEQKKMDAAQKKLAAVEAEWINFRDTVISARLPKVNP